MQKQPAPSVNEMPYSADDEIDLFELWNGLMAENGRLSLVLLWWWP